MLVKNVPTGCLVVIKYLTMCCLWFSIAVYEFIMLRKTEHNILFLFIYCLFNIVISYSQWPISSFNTECYLPTFEVKDRQQK